MSGENVRSAQRFKAELFAINETMMERARDIVLELLFDIVDNVVYKDLGDYGPGTPIDTGFAAASWWVSLGDMGTPHQATAPDPEFLKLRRKTKDKSIVFAARANEDAAVVATNFELGVPIYLLSNCAYIVALEKGWSDQAPTGMMRFTLDRAQELLNDASEKVMGKRE